MRVGETMIRIHFTGDEKTEVLWWHVARRASFCLNVLRYRLCQLNRQRVEAKRSNCMSVNLYLQCVGLKLRGSIEIKYTTGIQACNRFSWCNTITSAMVSDLEKFLGELLPKISYSIDPASHVVQFPNKFYATVYARLISNQRQNTVSAIVY